jgi:hypothetical protein
MLTYFDAVEHLIVASFGGPQDAEQRDIRSAIQRAYNEVCWLKDWQFTQTHGRIVFAPHWSGTVTYDATTRTVTRVSGDAFPSDAIARELRVNNVIAKVVTRVDNNTLVLDETLCLPKDYPDATQAMLYRTVYPMPDDFRNIDPPVNEVRYTSLMYVSPDAAMKMERAQILQGPPSYWTISPDPSPSGYAIRIIGYPVTVASLDFTYRRACRTLRLSGHEAASRQGTISAAGTAVTGSGTAFNASMVGSVLRVGGADYPQSLSGIAPYMAESKITAVASATSLTVADAVSASGAKYLITDPVDAPPGMHNVILSAAEYWLSRTRGANPDKVFQMYQRDLRLAMENDAMARQQWDSRTVWDPLGWRTPLMADNFDGGNA